MIFKETTEEIGMFKMCDWYQVDKETSLLNFLFKHWNKKGILKQSWRNLKEIFKINNKK